VNSVWPKLDAGDNVKYYTLAPALQLDQRQFLCDLLKHGGLAIMHVKHESISTKATRKTRKLLLNQEFTTRRSSTVNFTLTIG